MGQLQGKWALVTGSTRGIGQQIAKGLAGHGANIILHGRDKANLKETLDIVTGLGVESVSVAGELSTQSGVASVIDQVVSCGKSIDILYNNAAIISASKSIYDFDQSEWELVFQVNVYAPIAFCSSFVPGMKKRGWGRIVNLTSGIKGQPNLAPYSVSKAAIDKYTQDLAADVQGSGVLANFLDPGWLRTRMGGSGAMYDVEDVLPGALIPTLLEDDGPSGQFFAAMDYRIG